MITARFTDESIAEFNLTMTETLPNILIIDFPKKRVKIKDKKFDLLEELLGEFSVEVPVESIEITFDSEFVLTFEYVRNFLSSENRLNAIKDVYELKAKTYADTYVQSGMFLNDLIEKVYK